MTPGARKVLRSMSSCTALEVTDRFFRVGNAHAAGSGIGLTMVRELAEAHGGQVEAGNVPSGGAIFLLRLPVVSSGAHERFTVSVGEAARTMLDEGIRSLPVVDAEGRVVGLVTESDLTGARPWLSLPGWSITARNRQRPRLGNGVCGA